MRTYAAALTAFSLVLGLWMGEALLFRSKAEAAVPVNVWWPVNNVTVSGVQPFKAMLENTNVSDYSMYWQVDNGGRNAMETSWTDYPHKEAAVDLSGWTWRGSGPYMVTFTAVDSRGSTIGESRVSINVPVSASVVPIPTPAPSTTPTPSLTPTPKTSDVPAPHVTVVSPKDGTSVSGSLSFEASLDGADLATYAMYWQVDNGQKNVMQTQGNYKEAAVDVSGWSWRGSGPYELTFSAEKNGKTVASTKVTMFIGTAKASTSPRPTPTPTPSPSPVLTSALSTASGNPLGNVTFYVNPNSNAKRQADAWRSSRPKDAAQMDKIAQSSEAIWLGNWNGDVENDVRTKIADASRAGAAPVFIAYNIPHRDCGQYSAGGLSDKSAYGSWIKKIASGIGGKKAVVVLEPDALSLTDCLSGDQKADRFSMIGDAVTTLKNAGATVYVDAGNPGWISADDMASRLSEAGVGKADGFAVNVSNFKTTSDNIAYGSAISSKIGGKHFIVDTARNGNGPTSNNEWCNPSGRALGTRSTTATGNSLVDAFLWLKNPGESDGNCNGGPSAGVWWPEYALGLAERAAF